MVAEVLNRFRIKEHALAENHQFRSLRHQEALIILFFIYFVGIILLNREVNAVFLPVFRVDLYEVEKGSHWLAGEVATHAKVVVHHCPELPERAFGEVLFTNLVTALKTTSLDIWPLTGRNSPGCS